MNTPRFLLWLVIVCIGSASSCPTKFTESTPIAANTENTSNPPAALALQGKYRFHLVSANIIKTRSRKSDTLFVTFAVNVGDRAFGPITKDWGDREPNVYLFNNESTIHTEDITVNSDQPVRVSYSLVNAGHVPNAFQQVNEIGMRLKRMEINKRIGIDLDDNNFTNFLVDPQGFLTGLAISMIDPNCDGVVVADQITTTIGEIHARLNQTDSQGRFFWKEKNYKGTDSPAGCGANSDYSVSWRVTKVS